jgi:organic radical activating enzyme
MDDIVVTGGEPTMQSIDSFLEDNDLRRILTNHHCTLETNGTAAVKVPWAKLLSISPKVTADGTDGRMMAMWASETAQLITENPGSQVQLKFVLGNVGDIDIITSFLQDVYNQMSYASNSEILVMLMPVSVNPSYFDQLSRDIVDNIVLQNSGIDFRLCDRLHYRLWKGEQGK